jgi:hypothetical protein
MNSLVFTNIVPTGIDAGVVPLLREIILRDDHRFRHSAFETLRLLMSQPFGAREVLKDTVLGEAIVKLTMADIGHWFDVQAPGDSKQIVAEVVTNSEPQYSNGPYKAYTGRTLSQSAGLAAALQTLATLLHTGERLLNNAF